MYCHPVLSSMDDTECNLTAGCEFITQNKKTLLLSAESQAHVRTRDKGVLLSRKQWDNQGY